MKQVLIFLKLIWENFTGALLKNNVKELPEPTYQKTGDTMTDVHKKNKFLLVKEGVVLNEKQDRVISKLDKFFERANHIAYVTSGIRTAEDQLRIIKGYTERKKIQDKFIETATVNKKVVWEGREIYSWQLAWSKLLNAGVIINPPLRAEVLLDYIHRSGVNKKGALINPSVHFFGRAIDIGGGTNTITDEQIIVDEAIESNEIPEIKGTVPERENNCLHIDLVA